MNDSELAARLDRITYLLAAILVLEGIRLLFRVLAGLGVGWFFLAAAMALFLVVVAVLLLFWLMAEFFD